MKSQNISTSCAVGREGSTLKAHTAVTDSTLTSVAYGKSEYNSSTISERRDTLIYHYT